jgi:hypothetical protein
VICIRCRRQFQLNAGDRRKQQEMPGWVPSPRCHSCRWERRQEIPTKCGDCGREYSERRGRIEDLERSHPGALPTCGSCHAKFEMR